MDAKEFVSPHETRSSVGQFRNLVLTAHVEAGYVWLIPPRGEAFTQLSLEQAGGKEDLLKHCREDKSLHEQVRSLHDARADTQCTFTSEQRGGGTAVKVTIG